MLAVLAVAVAAGLAVVPSTVGWLGGVGLAVGPEARAAAATSVPLKRERMVERLLVGGALYRERKRKVEMDQWWQRATSMPLKRERMVERLLVGGALCR